VLTAILAVVLPILLFLGICASYVIYLISGSETRVDSGGGFGGRLEKGLYRRDTKTSDPDCVIQAVHGTDNSKMPHHLMEAAAAYSPNGGS
jgi:hypothetical protein